MGWIVMPYEPSLCSFKRAFQKDMGGSLQPGSRKFWFRKYNGSSAKAILLVEASTICLQVNQIMHCMHHCQALHQEMGAIHPSSYSG